MKSSENTLTYAMLMLVIVFWGLAFPVTKIALETISTFTLVFARFSLASLFFIMIMLRFGFPKLSRRGHAKVLLTALFEPGLYFTFETIGLQHTTAPKAALIIATVPVAVMVFAALFIGERPRAAGILGIGLSLIGIVILVVGDPNFTTNMGGSLLGDMLIFGAVVSAALYIVCARDLCKKHKAIDITGLQIIYGALMFTPLFLWELPDVQWSAVSSRSLVAVAYLTIFSTFAAFLLYNHALTKVPASRASVFVNGIPVVAAVAAWLLLGETLTVLQVGGGSMVLLAVCLTNLPNMNRPVKLIQKTA